MPNPSHGAGEEAGCLFPPRIHRHHLQLHPCARRRELVDAHRRAGRRPGPEILRHDGHHAVHVAHVGEVLGDLDDVGPGQALVGEDGLDGVHGAPGLVLDADGVIVLVQLVGVLVVERRGRGAGDEQQVAGGLDADGRGVGHVPDAVGLGVDLADAGVGGGGPEGRSAWGHGGWLR